MENVTCDKLKSVIDGRKNIYLILVSDGCPFCEEVLDNFHKLELEHDTLVVNVDGCMDEIDQIIDWPAIPMIAHFRDHKEVGRGVGVEGIMSFRGQPLDIEQGSHPTPATGEEVAEDG